MGYDYRNGGAGYAFELTIKTLRGCVGMISNAMIKSAAAISASKLINRVQKTYSQEDGVAVASTTGEGVAFYVCTQTGGATINKIAALVMDIGAGLASASIEVKRYDISGTSLGTVLTAPIVVAITDADYALVEGALAVTALDEGDVLVAQVVYTTGTTDHQGLLLQAEIDETGI